MTDISMNNEPTSKPEPLTTEEQFLQAIRDEPDNDDLKLIYADWLDDFGDPRGELIRLSVAMRRATQQAETEREWRSLLGIQMERHFPEKIYSAMAGAVSSRGTAIVELQLSGGISKALSRFEFQGNVTRFELHPLESFAPAENSGFDMTIEIPNPYQGDAPAFDIKGPPPPVVVSERLKEILSKNRKRHENGSGTQPTPPGQ